MTTMTCVYDGQKETFENDPCIIKCKNADIIIESCYGNWRTLRLNKPLKYFTELKVGRSCKVRENGYVKSILYKNI